MEFSWENHGLFWKGFGGSRMITRNKITKDISQRHAYNKQVKVSSTPTVYTLSTLRLYL